MLIVLRGKFIEKKIKISFLQIRMNISNPIRHFDQHVTHAFFLLHQRLPLLWPLMPTRECVYCYQVMRHCAVNGIVLTPCEMTNIIRDPGRNNCAPKENTASRTTEELRDNYYSEMTNYYGMLITGPLCYPWSFSFRANTRSVEIPIMRESPVLVHIIETIPQYAKDWSFRNSNLH